jgi:phosphate transport system protein
MAADHIVKSFDDQLRHLHLIIARMGGLAEDQLASAMTAIDDRDSALAARVIEQDAKVDELEREAEAQVIRLLALRQPMASDLRDVVAALKISSAIERIADYAKSIAKRTVALAEQPSIQPGYGIPRMGRVALAMLKDVLDAYNARNPEKALAVWGRDEELDEIYNSLFRELLTYMMEDPRSISTCTHLLFMAKNIERIGDHCTNIAEHVYYLVTGHKPGGERPRGGREEAQGHAAKQPTH